MNRYIKFVFFAVLFFCAGCDATTETPSNPMVDFVTATLPGTATPANTPSPFSPTLASTFEPVIGTTTAEVNVRVDTFTASKSLGTIPPFSTVQIMGRDASGLWFQIIFNETTGWVRAEFVQVGEASAEIPIVGVGSDSGFGVRGVILRGVNVRSGPGKDFDSLGLLNQNDVVPILGKDPSGAWMKIEYPPAPDGTGWVAAEYMQVDQSKAIPAVATETQAVVVNAPETNEPPAPNPVTADHDSAEVPLASFTISPATARSIQFQGTLSISGGDSEDWIGFSSAVPEIVIDLSCDSGGVQVELMRAGLLIRCGEARQVRVESEQVYLLKISQVSTGDVDTSRYELGIATESH